MSKLSAYKTNIQYLSNLGANKDFFIIILKLDLIAVILNIVPFSLDNNSLTKWTAEICSCSEITLTKFEWSYYIMVPVTYGQIDEQTWKKRMQNLLSAS